MMQTGQYVYLSAEKIEDFKRFLYERENSEATIKKYVTDIKKLFLFLDGDNYIDKLRLVQYKEWLVEKYKVSSVNSMIAALNQFLTFNGLDMFKIKRIKIQKNLFIGEEKELTQKEYRQLVHAARKQGKTQLALWIEVVASTGIRISELKYFTVERIKKGRIEIYNKGKFRRIFLSETVRRKLLSYIRCHNIKQGAVFITKSGKSKNRSNLWSEMKALEKSTGIDGRKIFPHNLRHLFARTYYKSTRDITGLADLLGHSSLEATRIYTANTENFYQTQLNKMTDLRI